MAHKISIQHQNIQEEAESCTARETRGTEDEATLEKRAEEDTAKERYGLWYSEQELCAGFCPDQVPTGHWSKDTATQNSRDTHSRYVFGIVKNRVEGVSGGPTAKRKHRDCVAAPNKTAGTGSPAPLMPVSCRYLPLNHCSFFFFPHRRGNFRLDWVKPSRVHACN